MATRPRGQQRHGLPESAVIYGAGGFGRRLALALREAGTEVIGFVDQAGQVPTDSRELSIHDVASAQLPLIVGISNPHVDLVALTTLLGASGIHQVMTPVQASLALHLAGVQLTNYWMTGDADLYSRERHEIDAARRTLSDDRSRAIFDAVIDYRQHGRLASLVDPDPISEQYFPSDLPFIRRNMRYVDVGAYDGDTVRLLADCPVALEALLSFEPDPQNFAMLSEEIRLLNIREALPLPLALGRSNEMLRFDATSSSSARLDDHGSTFVQSVRFDSLAPSWAPTHVKMDVEGAEFEVLEGMRATLNRYRPSLAIAIYHEPRHHWAIVNWIRELDLGYCCHIRTYAHQTFDTVLYCMPTTS